MRAPCQALTPLGVKVSETLDKQTAMHYSAGIKDISALQADGAIVKNCTIAQVISDGVDDEIEYLTCTTDDLADYAIENQDEIEGLSYVIGESVTVTMVPTRYFDGQQLYNATSISVLGSSASRYLNADNAVELFTGHTPDQATCPNAYNPNLGVRYAQVLTMIVSWQDSGNGASVADTEECLIRKENDAGYTCPRHTSNLGQSSLSVV